jgi:DNA polymerase elongation subunit (family B)
MHRIEDRAFRASFFVKVPPSELPDLQRRLEILDQVAATRVVMRRTSLAAESPEPLLEVVPRHYGDLLDAARIVDSAGGYYEHELFDVDLRYAQRYFLQHRIFPMGLVAYDGAWRALEEHFALEYEIPDLRRAVLDVAVDAPAGLPRMNDRLLGASLGGDAVDGDEEDVLRGINALVEDHDPDIVLTDGGDAFVLPFLEKKADALGVDLRLGRDPGFHGRRSPKSYFTYGKIVYKPGQYLLKGRLHLDRGHFAVRESGFAGLVELSRLSALPPQEQARLTPGTAFTSMQTNLAHEDGVAVLWKKNLPEAFKSAEELVLGDRGGFIFEPEVGLHEGIVEIDYASLYPNIMVKHNISQETLDCPCCPLNGQPVPGLKYHTCTRRLGLIPRVLRPLVERKRYYKRMKKERTPLQEVYEGRDTILKWLLVTAFSDTKDTATRATVASSVTRRLTRTRATSSSSRCASRSSTGSRSCTASSTRSGCGPPPRRATCASSSSASTRTSAFRSTSRARTAGSCSSRARRRASAP